VGWWRRTRRTRGQFPSVVRAVRVWVWVARLLEVPNFAGNRTTNAPHRATRPTEDGARRPNRTHHNIRL